MTSSQKQAIQEQRSRGLTFLQIAESLGLSINTIKSFCRRNLMGACSASIDTENVINKGLCKHCGKQLKHIDKAKPKTFCHDECRRVWWNSHRNQMNRKAVYRLICACCGEAFESYGNVHRKYCSRACYIRARFREKFHEQRAV